MPRRVVLLAGMPAIAGGLYWRTLLEKAVIPRRGGAINRRGKCAKSFNSGSRTHIDKGFSPATRRFAPSGCRKIRMKNRHSNQISAARLRLVTAERDEAPMMTDVPVTSGAGNAPLPVFLDVSSSILSELLAISLVDLKQEGQYQAIADINAVVIDLRRLIGVAV